MSRVVHRFNVFLNHGNTKENREFLNDMAVHVRNYVKLPFLDTYLDAWPSARAKKVSSKKRKAKSSAVYITLNIAVTEGRVELDLPTIRDAIAKTLPEAQRTGKPPHVSLRYIGCKVDQDPLPEEAEYTWVDGESFQEQWNRI